MAEAILKQRVIGINDEDCEHVNYPALGQDWVKPLLN
jgi:hypothetical protein